MQMHAWTEKESIACVTFHSALIPCSPPCFYRGGMFRLIPLSNRLYPLEPDELSVILGEYFARKTPMNTDELFLRPFRPNAGENYSTANDVNNPKAQQEVYDVCTAEYIDTWKSNSVLCLIHMCTMCRTKQPWSRTFSYLMLYFYYFYRQIPIYECLKLFYIVNNYFIVLD